MGAEGVTNTYSNAGTKRNGSRSLLLLLLLLLLLHSQQKEHRKPVERQPLIASLLHRPEQPQIVTKNKWGKAAGTHLRGELLQKTSGGRQQAHTCEGDIVGVALAV